MRGISLPQKVLKEDSPRKEPRRTVGGGKYLSREGKEIPGTSRAQRWPSALGKTSRNVTIVRQRGRRFQEKRGEEASFKGEGSRRGPHEDHSISTQKRGKKAGANAHWYGREYSLNLFQGEEGKDATTRRERGGQLAAARLR